MWNAGVHSRCLPPRACPGVLLAVKRDVSALSLSQDVLASTAATVLRRKPEMPTPELIALAGAAAVNHALDFTFSVSSVPYTGQALVCAIIEQESAWNPHAIRYEPGFRTRYVAPLGLPPTEEIARSISWGLMQVMGQVAREHGFTGKFLSALCDPALGLDIGCAALASKLTIRLGSSSRGNNATEGSLFAGGSANLQADKESAEPNQRFSREVVGGSAGLQAREKPAELSQGFSPGAPLSQIIAEAQGKQQSGQGIDASEIAHPLAVWNGGSNPNYAAEVLARLPHYK